ncbi:hypothetical protein K474DRAFT_1674726 [Panus rudis PR-1116 ss-1]|nr:hypothetical protein K474DRAFT_1674726 [Panus rudis PR-1116 ss-1]
MSTATKDATVQKAQGSKHPPVLTAGSLTPAVINQWNMTELLYFDRKTVPIDKQVSSVAGEIEDERVLSWYLSDAAFFKAMAWADFVTAFRARWLPTGWESEIVTRLLRFRQAESTSFEEWVTAVETQNALLRTTSFYKDEDAVRELLSANCIEELRVAAGRKAFKDITVYKEWKEAMAEVDRTRIREQSRHLKTIENFFNTRMRSVPNTRNGNNTPNNPSTAGSRSTNISTRCPPLTVEEKKLLSDHKGCYHCRRFYAGHVSQNCPVGFPDPKTYRTLTAADADAAKAKIIVRSAVAAIDVDDPPAVVSVGAVRANLPFAVASSVLSSGDDTDSDLYAVNETPKWI